MAITTNPVKDPTEVLKGLFRELITIKPNRRVFIIDAEKVRIAIIKLREAYGETSVYLSTLAGVDKPDKGVIELNYFIHIIPRAETIVLRTTISRDNPRISSVLDILPGAFSGECETYDLLGVVFEGNPFLKRTFFVPSEVVEKGVFPLRKEFRG